MMNIDKVSLTELITKGEELLKDEALDTSSGKLKAFRSTGKELLKHAPELVKEFESATNLSHTASLNDSINPATGISKNQETRHKCAIEAVTKGIEFLKMLS